MIIKIKNLRLRTIIGVNEWEKHVKQDVIINVTMEFNADQAIDSDQIQNTVSYKKITKDIINLVEDNTYNLLESLAHAILHKVMEYTSITSATVEIDKPHALRFADSVSATCSRERSS